MSISKIGPLLLSNLVMTTSYKTFSVAPMMAHTNRHFRYFWRLLSKDTILYTEMIMADRIVELRNNPYELKSYLDFHTIEEPLVLQLGGNDPIKLKEAVEICSQYGYQYYNLNCGCPSNIVATESCMGARMMFDPVLTAQCCAAMMELLTSNNQNSSHNTLSIENNKEYPLLNEQHSNKLQSSINSRKVRDIPFLTVKCRIGVDEYDSYEHLCHFIHTVSTQGNVKRFQIHARKAILNLGTKENRDIPPLKYDVVYRLLETFPHLEFELNGGINTPDMMYTQLYNYPTLCGIMTGRACINHPYMWIHTDRLLQQLSQKYISNNNNNLNSDNNNHISNIDDDISSIISSINTKDIQVPSRGEILSQYANYCDQQFKLNKKIPSNVLLAPIYNLLAGEEYCDKYRRKLKKLSIRTNDAGSIIRFVLSEMPSDVLSERRGLYTPLDELIIHEKLPQVSAPMHSRIL